jgi:flavin reductase (DIM6/NTAB) family NADH-FMN oxidoreductase RutF
MLKPSGTVDVAKPPAADARTAFAHVAKSVSVLTAVSPHGPSGMTVSSLCGLTLCPARLLVSVQTRSRTFAALTQSGRFAISVLPDSGRDIASLFSQPQSVAKFAGAHLAWVTGLPVVAEAVAWFLCRLEYTYPVADHTIVVGRAHAWGVPGGAPLVRYGREYWGLASQRSVEG